MPAVHAGRLFPADWQAWKQLFLLRCASAEKGKYFHIYDSGYSFPCQHFNLLKK